MKRKPAAAKWRRKGKNGGENMAASKRRGNQPGEISGNGKKKMASALRIMNWRRYGSGWRHRACGGAVGIAQRWRRWRGGIASNNENEKSENMKISNIGVKIMAEKPAKSKSSNEK